MGRIEGLDKLLKKHPFFMDMEESSRKILCGCAKNERFDAGDMIVHEGEAADKFYLIRSGLISLEFHLPNKYPCILETLHDGDVFGWSWIVPPFKWLYDIRAVELSRMISLEAKCLCKKIQKDHALGFDLYSKFIPVMAKRLSAARLQMIDMYGKP
jgi:CRP-like cAMP-binding protein